MEKLNKEFKNVKDSDNPDEINDFLIKLGKNPQHNHITFLKYFIEITDPEIHEQIKINLVYDLGEIGKLEIIDVKFIDYLMKEYYNSDRWIRNEIIVAFRKISMNTDLSEQVIQLIGNSLKEDYAPIKTNALKALSYINNIPKSLLKNILYILNSSNSELEELSTNILRKSIKNEFILVDLLDSLENYKILNKKGIRSILLIYFNSVDSLESFRELILKSKWDINYKEMFLNEIDDYQRLLLKNR
ncbi:MAG: hypothetical protein EU529_01235 [Promethearchaeota archaeon]|nr:MAG: hypothetical protein EU529_01235 [Candidatus Lokiarchaeota archaeon]